MAHNNSSGLESVMGSARLRSLFCWVLIGLIPGSLLGAGSGAAMLYAKGTAWINGSTVPRSAAVFPGDLVQTRPDAVVHINAAAVCSHPARAFDVRIEYSFPRWR